MGTSLTIPYYIKSKGPDGRDLAQGFIIEYSSLRDFYGPLGTNNKSIFV